MGKFTKIAISSVLILLAAMVLTYLFVIPNVVNLNSFKPDIEKEIKKAANLNVNLGELGFKTNPDLSITVTSEKPSVSYLDNTKLAEIENLSVSISLLPVLFKELQVKDVIIEKPGIYLTRLKDGKYRIEELLNLPQSETTEEPPIKPVINGLDISISDYVIKLTDKSSKKGQNISLKGDLVKVTDLNPEKFVGIEALGQLLVGNNPSINYDIKIESELPPVKIEVNEQEDTQEAKEVQGSQDTANIDPIASFLKYDLKSDIKADLKIKGAKNFPKIDGFINFDRFSIKLDGKKLPDSFGKLDFSGKGVDIDSKLFISPEEYLAITGKVENIEKQKYDLSVKSSEIYLKDIKKFALSLADALMLETQTIRDASLSGVLKADFQLKKDNFKGYLNITDTNLSYKGVSHSINDFNSDLKFDKDKVIFENSYGNIGDIRFNIEGFINAKNYADLKVDVPNLNLKTIHSILTSSSLFKDLKPALADITSMGGSLSAKAALKGYLDKELKPEITINIINPTLTHKILGTPVSLTKGEIKVLPDDININDLEANIVQTPVYISGKIKDYTAKNPTPAIKLNIPRLELAKITYFANSSAVDKQTRKLLYDLKNIKGHLEANAKVSALDKFYAELILSKVSAYYAPEKMPVYISGGKINANQDKAVIEEIELKISESPVKISGEVSDLLEKPELNIRAKGSLSSKDIKKLSPPDVQKAIVTKGDLPLFAKISGTPESWQLLSQLDIDNISYMVELDRATGTKNIINISTKGNDSFIEFINSGLFAGQNISRDKSGVYNLTSASRLVSLNGKISKYNTPAPVVNNLKVDINSLGLSLVEPKGKVQLNGNLNINGKLDKLSALGVIGLRNINIPETALKAKSIDIALKEREILVNTDLINILNSKLKVIAVLENKINPPFIAKDVQVTAEYLDTDKLNEKFPPVPDQDTPMIIKSGKFYAKELVASALSHKDLSFGFVLNPLNNLKIRNFKSTTANGNVVGVIDMNLKTSKLDVDLSAENMDVNILATQAAKLPDEIQGTAKGRIKLSTWGWTPEQVNNNAVGRADFKVENGVLQKIGSFKNLLNARNMFKSGLTQSQLNNAAENEEVEQANHFEYIKGVALINKGTVNIPELYMQGRRLSTFLSGNINQQNNYADIKILGKASGKVVRQLGPIKDLSVNRLINKAGSFGAILAQTRLATQYPHLDKIPPITEEPLPDDKRFAVTINGNLQSPGAVRFFEWLD